MENMKKEQEFLDKKRKDIKKHWIIIKIMLQAKIFINKINWKEC